MHVHCFVIVCIALKMARKPLCLNSPAKSKGQQKHGKGKKDDDAAPPPQAVPNAKHQWTVLSPQKSEDWPMVPDPSDGCSDRV